MLTGTLAQVQLAGLRPEDVDWEGRSLWVRGRRKGASGKVRKGHRKPITDEAIAALHRFKELDCWGSFSRSSMRQSLQRACRRVEHMQGGRRRGGPEPGPAVRLPPLLRDRRPGLDPGSPYDPTAHAPRLRQHDGTVCAGRGRPGARRRPRTLWSSQRTCTGKSEPRDTPRYAHFAQKRGLTGMANT